MYIDKVHLVSYWNCRVLQPRECRLPGAWFRQGGCSSLQSTPLHPGMGVFLSASSPTPCKKVFGWNQHIFFGWFFSFFQDTHSHPKQNLLWQCWMEAMGLQVSRPNNIETKQRSPYESQNFQRFWVQSVWSLSRWCPARDPRSEGGTL